MTPATARALAAELNHLLRAEKLLANLDNSPEWRVVEAAEDWLASLKRVEGLRARANGENL